MNGVTINGNDPKDILIGGRSVLCVMINSQKVWPTDVTPDTPLDIDAILSCFGMGLWEDSLPWNDNAIWSD